MQLKREERNHLVRLLAEWLPAAELRLSLADLALQSIVPKGATHQEDCRNALETAERRGCFPAFLTEVLERSPVLKNDSVVAGLMSPDRWDVDGSGQVVGQRSDPDGLAGTGPRGPGRLTWLHMSDFHFRKTPSWQQSVVLEALLRDVMRKLPGEDLDPDLVFVTGDVAFSGKKEEYAQALEFFKAVSGTLGHDPVERFLAERWVVVPGNHDVNRDSIDPAAWNLSLKDEKALDDLLTRSKQFGPLFTSRQRAFNAFTAKLLGKERAWTPKQPWRTDLFDIGGVRVASIGLNTAWASGRNDEYGKLLTGVKNVRAAIREADQAGARLKIACYHHPLDYLVEHDRIQVDGLLDSPDGAHFRLRGHLHKSRLSATASPDLHSLEFAAGACWEDANWPHGVSVVQLDFETCRGSVHLWRYASLGRGFWTRDNFAYEHVRGGRWEFQLPAAWGL